MNANEIHDLANSKHFYFSSEKSANQLEPQL